MRSRILPALLAVAALLVMMTAPAAAGPPSVAPNIDNYTLQASCIDGEPLVNVSFTYVAGLGAGYVAVQIDSGDITQVPESDLTSGFDMIDDAPTFSYEFSVAVDPGTREITTFLAYEPEVDVSSASDTIVVEGCGDTEPACDTQANGYGRKIIDCFGAPYGQLHRASDERPAQGAKLFWMENSPTLQ